MRILSTLYIDQKPRISIRANNGLMSISVFAWRAILRLGRREHNTRKKTPLHVRLAGRGAALQVFVLNAPIFYNLPARP